MDQDWTEVVPAAPPQSRTHTFVLGDSEMSSSLLMTMSTPATIRAASAGAAALKSRPAARSKIPAATARRSHGAALETSCSNGALAAAWRPAVRAEATARWPGFRRGCFTRSLREVAASPARWPHMRCQL